MYEAAYIERVRFRRVLNTRHTKRQYVSRMAQEAASSTELYLYFPAQMNCHIYVQCTSVKCRAGTVAEKPPRIPFDRHTVATLSCSRTAGRVKMTRLEWQSRRGVRQSKDTADHELAMELGRLEKWATCGVSR